MEKMIDEMGYAFRSLVYHTEGRYSCGLGYSFVKGTKGQQREFWGDTALEAVTAAYEALEQMEEGECRDL